MTKKTRIKLLLPKKHLSGIIKFSFEVAFIPCQSWEDLIQSSRVGNA
jgi:hypothetical protein